MSYQSGKMGAAAGIALVFILVNARLIVASSPTLIANTMQAVWQAVFLGGILSLLMMWLMLLVFRQVPGDIISVADKLIGKVGAWLIGIAYIFIFWLSSISLLREYTENTLIVALHNTEFMLVLLWFTVVISIMCFYGIEVIARIAYLIMPIIIIGIMAVLLLLAPFYKEYNLFPLLGTGLSPVLLNGVQAAGFNVGVFLLVIMAPTFQNEQSIKQAANSALGISIPLKSFYFIVIMMVYGITAAEKNVLFYELARLVYINRYFQRVESLLIIIWVFVGVLAIAIYMYLVFYLLTKLFRLPTARPIILPLMLVTMQLAAIPSSFAEAVKLDELVGKFNTIAVYIVPILLYLALKVKQRKNLTDNIDA